MIFPFAPNIGRQCLPTPLEANLSLEYKRHKSISTVSFSSIFPVVVSLGLDLHARACWRMLCQDGPTPCLGAWFLGVRGSGARTDTDNGKI